ncbi:EamA/RhaT family transporter, partial [Mesorhizobium sp. M1322]
MLLSPNLRGALFMVVAMIGFTLNDAITKVSSESMNMAQVMLIRGAFASLFVGLLAWQRGALALPGSMLQPMVAVRVARAARAAVWLRGGFGPMALANLSALVHAQPRGGAL